MDRLSQLREDPGSSKDTSLDSTSPSSVSFLTANDSTKYFSLSDTDSSLDVPNKDVTLAESNASTIQNTITESTSQLISDISPINKNNLLDGYKLDKHIEAVNILSGGVNIFDDNDNSYDGNELVIDDNVIDLQDDRKSTVDTSDGDSQGTNVVENAEEAGTSSPSKETAVVFDTDVVLQIDGKNVNGINIGNGLYLYRLNEDAGELSAVQILTDTDDQQPTVKFLKVRDNAEGNLEVYEEIVKVRKEVPEHDGKLAEKNTSHVPIKNINKVINDNPAQCKITERKNKEDEEENISGTSSSVNLEKVADAKTEISVHSKAVKFPSEARKSPLIGSFTAMTFHSTPNKEGIPLTKTMVDLQLHINRPSDIAKKTIEVNTDSCKHRLLKTPIKSESSTSTADGTSLSVSKIDLDQTYNQESKIYKNKLDILQKVNDVKENQESSSIQTNIEAKVDSNVKSDDLSKSSDDLNIVGDNFEKIKGVVLLPIEENVDNNTDANIICKNELMDDRLVTQELEKSKIESNSDKLCDNIYKSGNNDVRPDENLALDIDIKENRDAKEINKEIAVQKLKVETGDIQSVFNTKILEVNKKNEEEEALNENPTKNPEICSSIKIKYDDTNIQQTVAENNIQVSKEENKIVKDPVVPKEDNQCVFNTKILEVNKKIEEEEALNENPTKNPEICSSIQIKYDDTNIQQSVAENIQVSKEENKIVEDPVVTKGDIQCVVNTEILEVNKKIEEEEALNENSAKNPEICRSIQIKYDDTNIQKTVADNNIQVSKEENKIVEDPVVTKGAIQRVFNTKILEVNKKIEEQEALNENPVKNPEICSSIQIKYDHTNIQQTVAENNIQVSKEENKIVEDPVVTKIKDQVENVELIKDISSPIGSDKNIVSNFDILENPKEVDTKQIILQNEKELDFKEIQLRDGITTKIKENVIEDTCKTYAQQDNLEKKTSQDKVEDNKYINKYVSEALGVKNETNTTLKTKEPVKVQSENPKEHTAEKPEIPKCKVLNDDTKQKSINNNNAVPFGKWTEANKQEYLNKIKESKSSIGNSSTNQIKQTNDLNRRDVLMKISRQNANMNTITQKKDFTTTNKVPIKNETIVQPKKTISNVTMKKVESLTKTQVTEIEITTNIPKVDKRTEINNQDLIDKTIEGILMDKNLPPKSNHDVEIKQTIIKDNVKDNIKKSKPATNTKPLSVLDDIEQKMNELHGIPFKERPVHELPHRFTEDPKNYGNIEMTSAKIPNLVPLDETIQKKDKLPKDNVVDDEHSEEEISECQPITGDIEINKKSKSMIPTSVTREQKIQKDCISIQDDKKFIQTEKEVSPIITERDFDKFARRNSITYENQITVNIDSRQQYNVVQTIVEKSGSKHAKSDNLITENKSLIKPRTYSSKNQILNKSKQINNEEAQNKNYSSKLQMAYHSALTAKRQKESPLTIIEDKPVKVLYVDSNTDFPSYKLNVQGQELNSSKNKQNICESDIHTFSSCDSLDSDILENVESKSQDETKVKTKHQRKQVLTPVETPELELIEPKDLGIVSTPKRKRRTEESTKQSPTIDYDESYKKNTKKVVPKKSYLLGRNTTEERLTTSKEKVFEETLIKYDSAKEPLKESLNGNVTDYSKKDTISNPIDSLVKAAELLENQPDAINAITNYQVTTHDVSQNQFVKRGRGRPRKYPLQDGGATPQSTTPSPQKKLRVNTTKVLKSETESSDIDTDEEIVKENWTMGKINEDIVCPICNKLFRSENVVFKHVKHCTGPSPSRGSSSTDKNSRKRRRVYSDRNFSDSQDSDTESDGKVSSRSISEKHTSNTQDKDDVIIIEDTPVKKIQKTETVYNKKSADSELSNVKSKGSKTIKPQASQQSSLLHRTSNLVCEFCGKKFRQLSYLVSHKELHKKEELKKSEKQNQTQDKSVFACEVCKKQFRKLHHLVQHRIIHTSESNVTSRSQRKISAESNDNKTLATNNEVAKTDKDNGAGFRCEQCDKSFRKLHHLVEHRETHVGINKLKTNVAQNNIEKASASPPQCDVCKKTFRKLHHLIEHKEQHLESNKGDKSDNKKNTLVTKDIIHECSLCYMVFPNEHSLNKHTVICQRKKRQSKQTKDDASKNDEETSSEELLTEQSLEDDIPVDSNVITGIEVIDKNKEPDNEIINKNEEDKVEIVKPLSLSLKRNSNDLDKNERRVPDVPVKVKKVEETKEEETPAMKVVEITDKSAPTKDKIIVKKEEKEAETKPTESVGSEKVEVAIKKKTPAKAKITATVTKKQKTSGLPLPVVDRIDLSDDDDVRYMLNPDYKEDTCERNVFMKVRVQKRNSLQIERPKSKESAVRRISLQHPPKIPRAKPTRVIPKRRAEPVPSSSNDDNEIKYSFPKSSDARTRRASTAKVEPEAKRRSVPDKRSSLGGIAKRKSSGKTKATAKPAGTRAAALKKTKAEAGHRCDCGQLFGSAALLARHHTLAHTPPRRARRREPSPAPSARGPARRARP